MLKIEDAKKVIELNGKEVELNTVSAKKQVAFVVRIEKEKDQNKQIDLMISYMVELGIKKATAEKISLKGLQDIIGYVGDVEKK